jgi:hypothetical protein
MAPYNERPKSGQPYPALMKRLSLIIASIA